MSRAFVLDTPSNPKTAKVEKGRTVAETVDKQTAVLRAVADEISSLSPEVVNEAVIATASTEEGKTAEMKAKKLEALRHQNELIEDERKEAELAAKALKESKETAKAAVAEPSDAGAPTGAPPATASSTAADADAETPMERDEREAVARRGAEIARMMAAPPAEAEAAEAATRAPRRAASALRPARPRPRPPKADAPAEKAPEPEAEVTT